MGKKPQIGPYSKKFITFWFGSDNRHIIKNFMPSVFEVKDGIEPKMPINLEEHNRAILTGTGLKNLLDGEWRSESDGRFGSHFPLPLEIKAWAENRLQEIEMRESQVRPLGYICGQPFTIRKLNRKTQSIAA
jgi:hypothetical protein